MKNLDMTKGNALSVILRFAIPLMLGDLFQQLYIAVDSMMIGRYAGVIPLAAVTSSTFLIRLIIGLFVGIAAGASVVVAHSVGARDEKKVVGVVNTMAGLTLIGGVIVTAVGILGARPLLHAVSVPEQTMGEAMCYLRVYFAGALFSLIYNVGSGILCSFGDSKRPFLYLSISSVVNIVLDYLFIRNLQWGAAGAAFATVIAQVISAVLISADLKRRNDAFMFCPWKLKIEKALIGEILRMGLPAGLQNAVVALSNVIVQANINYVGYEAMAGFGVFNKVDGIIMLPLSSIALALTTYTAQNFGAGKKERITEGFRAMLILEAISWLMGTGVCVLFGERILGLFSSEEGVIRYGMMTMRYMIPGYWGLGIGYALTCMIRGMGKSRAASIIFIFNMCVARQLFILVVKQQGFGMEGIILSYPFSWVMTIAGGVCYIVYLQRKTAFLSRKESRVW